MIVLIWPCKNMLKITFLVFVLIGIFDQYVVINGAPTPDGDNELSDSKITKTPLDRDPVRFPQ